MFTIVALLIWIYCWMTNWTNAVQCSFFINCNHSEYKTLTKAGLGDQTVKYLHCLQQCKCFLKKKSFLFTVMSSDPALECLPFLERRLQETNNLPAFLANVRKEFISLVRRWDWENCLQTGQIQVTATQHHHRLFQTKLNFCNFLFLNVSSYWF